MVFEHFALKINMVYHAPNVWGELPGGSLLAGGIGEKK